MHSSFKPEEYQLFKQYNYQGVGYRGNIKKPTEKKEKSEKSGKNCYCQAKLLFFVMLLRNTGYQKSDKTKQK